MIRSSYIVITIGTLGYVPYGIQHIDDLIAYNDKNAAVIGADPESSLFIDIKTVDVLDTGKFIHKTEGGSVVAVETGITSNPQDTVMSLYDIIGMST